MPASTKGKSRPRTKRVRSRGASNKKSTLKGARGEGNEDNLTEEDHYCMICDDGGDLIDCDLCNATCCYDELPERPNATDDELIDRACITLPAGFLQDKLSVFSCPSCLAKHPDTPVDYVMNRSTRATQRRTATVRLVIIVACLSQLAERGLHIFESIQSVLRGFEMTITFFACQLPETLHPKDIKSVLKLDGPYHLVFAFLTESNPTGGWWFDDDAQENKGAWLKGLLAEYDSIARSALSARIFGLCCGVNLPGAGVVRDLVEALQGLKWSSLVLPATSAIMPEEYATILPELFLQLYYNGAELRSSLLRIWAASKRCRTHTDLFVIDQIQEETKMSIRKYSYAAYASRPWGIDLPSPESFCGCEKITENPRWNYIPLVTEACHEEYFACYRSACSHSYVRVAVFAHRFKMVDIRGTHVVQQDFDLELDEFPLDNAAHVKLRVSLVSSQSAKGNRHQSQHDSAWTVRGQEMSLCVAGRDSVSETQVVRID